jgi:hypothetical protein
MFYISGSRRELQPACGFKTLVSFNQVAFIRMMERELNVKAAQMVCLRGLQHSDNIAFLVTQSHLKNVPMLKYPHRRCKNQIWTS